MKKSNEEKRSIKQQLQKEMAKKENELKLLEGEIKNLYTRWLNVELGKVE